MPTAVMGVIAQCGHGCYHMVMIIIHHLVGITTGHFAPCEGLWTDDWQSGAVGRFPTFLKYRGQEEGAL